MRREDEWAEFYEMERAAQYRQPKAGEPKVTLHLDDRQLASLAAHQAINYGEAACTDFLRSKLLFEERKLLLIGSVSPHRRSMLLGMVTEAEQELAVSARAIGIEFGRHMKARFA